MPSGNAIRVVSPRLAFALALSLALSFVGTSMATGRVVAAPSDADPSAFPERAEAVIVAALQYVGRPYRLGTEGPDLFDCSGLVFRSFADAGELSQIGGARMTAARYRNWFASRGMFTLAEAEAQPGDLVMFGGGEHIGIYLGDRQVLSALLTGVTVHPLDGISIEVTGFLKVDWSGKRKKSPPGAATNEGSGTEVEEPATETPVLPEEPANLGLPSYNTFERFQMGADTLAVNVATGNLVFSHPVASLPVGDSAHEIVLTYNSQSTVNSGLSPGWRLSASRQLTEHENGDVTFTAGDGSWHTFTVRKVRGSITRYSRPVTLYATLRRDTSQTPEWTLTYRDESVDYFVTRGSEAALARSVDHLGNVIDFSYGQRSQLLRRATDTIGRQVEFDWDKSAIVARLVKITEWAPLDDTEDAEASETAPLRQHRFFYDADGYLAGWGGPLESRGRCPKVSEDRTCLGYAAGRLATISNRLPVGGAELTGAGAASRDVVTTRIAYVETTAEVGEVSATEYTEADAIGVTEAAFERIAPDRVRVVRSGTSPVTTMHRLVSVADPLGRVRRTARDWGQGMTVEQRTVWDAEQPTEPARVTTPLGTVSYRYVAGSMGLVSHTVEQLSGTKSTTTRHDPAQSQPLDGALGPTAH